MPTKLHGTSFKSITVHHTLFYETTFSKVKFRLIPSLKLTYSNSLSIKYFFEITKFGYALTNCTDFTIKQFLNKISIHLKSVFDIIIVLSTLTMIDHLTIINS